MINLKKQILDYKIKKTIKEFPYILFIQFNNTKPKNWRVIKHKLYKLGNINLLRVKNKVAFKILKHLNYKKNLLDSLPVVHINEADKDTVSTKLTSKEKRAFSLLHLSIDEIFQGPILMLSCSMVEQLPAISTILDENPNLFFVGGLFENQVITHLDFKKIIQLDNSIFKDFIQQCSNPIDSIFFVKSLMDLRCFTAIQKQLLQVLQIHKSSLP